MKRLLITALTAVLVGLATLSQASAATAKRVNVTGEVIDTLTIHR